jgi:hypothetical protein
MPRTTAWSFDHLVSGTFSSAGPRRERVAVATLPRCRPAVSHDYHLPPQDLPTRLMMGTAPGRWLMRLLAAHQPEQYVKGELAGEGELTPDELTARVEQVLADPDARSFALDLGPTAMPDKQRKPGYDNDLAQFAAITSLELEKITAPTLVVQGTADADLPRSTASSPRGPCRTPSCSPWTAALTSPSTSTPTAPPPRHASRPSCSPHLARESTPARVTVLVTAYNRRPCLARSLHKIVIDRLGP